MTTRNQGGRTRENHSSIHAKVAMTTQNPGGRTIDRDIDVPAIVAMTTRNQGGRTLKPWMVSSILLQ